MKIIKIELKKAFTGSRFWLAFCIGQFLGISSILTVYRSWLSQRDYIQYWENRFPVRQAYTLYNVWILNEQLSVSELIGCGLVFAAVILAQIPEFIKKNTEG